jgi:asparagine synthase (glutamine-hydrolysing)
MFAFAVWDSRDRELFLVRDRLGVKPLYYAVRDGALLFASEEKALFAAQVPAHFDTSTLEELLCFRYVAGERTPYLGVRRLLPGHQLVWKDGMHQVRRWWSLAERTRALRDESLPSVVRWYRETFDDAVRVRRISDVPVGVLLSGGLDSGSVAASLGSQSSVGIASFTVAFDESRYDEHPEAREVAKRWNLIPHELRVPPSELLGRVLEASWLNDEPLAHGSDVHLRAISGYAKPIVTVLLSGEGGDETLGGYLRYRPLQFPWLIRAVRPFVSALTVDMLAAARLRKLGRLLELGTDEALVLFSSCDVLPDDIGALGLQPLEGFAFRASALAEAKATYPSDLVRQAMYLDHHTYLCSLLDRNDRMTMGASIECRVPFLDFRLVERLAALSTDRLLSRMRSKALLRAAVGYRLPKSVLRRPKWGFGVPWSEYLRRIPALREVVASLPQTPPLCDAPFDRSALRRIVNGFLGGDSRRETLVQQLFMICVWHEACIRSPWRARSDSSLSPARAVSGES